MAEAHWVIGTMSGTSMDGVDAAFVRSDGERIFEHGPWLSIAYDAATRRLLKSVLGGQGDVRAATALITTQHAGAINKLIEKNNITREKVKVIGFHGQTILHRPEVRRTVQIGDGAALAAATGIAVVNDFRQADVAAGGEGAPFAPLYHGALAAGLDKPMAVLNLGGVANVTLIDADNRLLAFDTGPASALIDDLMLTRCGQARDENGDTARGGEADQARIEAWLGLDYFSLAPPKSLDREAFVGCQVDDLSLPDAAATLTEFTARSVARAGAFLTEPPGRWLVTGGGRHNGHMMDRLRAHLGVPVDPVEVVGWRGDALEAEAFGFLALRSLRGLPLSLPGTTGVAAPMPGGRLHKPNCGQR